MEGKPVAELKRNGQMSQRVAAGLQTVARMELAEYQEAFRAKAQAVVMRAIEKIEGKLDAGEGSLGQLTMLAGVLQDKIAAQKQGPSSVHLHLHGQDRGSILKTVLGRDTDRERIGSGDSGSRANIPPTGPVLDAEVLPDSAQKEPPDTP